MIKGIIDEYSEASTLDKREKEYWDNWIENATCLLNENSDDYVLRSLYEVMDLAVKDCQYSIPSEDYKEVKRVVKFRVNLSKEEIRQMFGLKVYGIYGSGIYTELEGIVCSPFARDLSGYDSFMKKGHYSLDYSFIPEDILKDLEVRLVVPAMSGLFIPKKSNFVNWIRSARCLEYFDIT